MADVTKLRPEQQAAVDAFHKLYYPFFGDTRWLGLPTAKCPMDLFVYQEMIFELQPDLIIEDTNVNGHPVVPEFGPGPMEAVELFLRENDDFVIDRSKEKFLLSFNPKGFLRRLQPQESSHKKDVIISQQREELFDLRRQVEALQQQAGKAEQTLDRIFNSTSWKFLQRWRSARNLFLPEGSARRKIYHRLLEKFR